MNQEVRSTVSSRLNSEYFDRRNRQRDRILTNYQELSRTNQEQEDQLRAQVNDLLLQLEVLKTKKRRARINFNMQKEWLDSKLHELTTQHSQLSQEIDTQEGLTREDHAVSSLEESETLKTFMHSIRPLEDASQIVLEEKQQAEQSLTELMQRLEDLNAEFSGLNAEIRKNQTEIEQLQSDKYQREREFFKIKAKNPLEYDEIVQEVEIQRQVAALKEKKSKKSNELNEIDRKIAETERDHTEATAKLERWERHRTAGSVNAQEEAQLTKLENELAVLCHDLLPLDKAISLAAKERGIDITACIVKEQYKLIEDHESKIVERVKVKNKAFQAKINELNHIVQQELAMGPDAHSSVMELQQTIRKIEIEAHYFNRTNNYMLENLSAWKSSPTARLNSRKT